MLSIPVSIKVLKFLMVNQARKLTNREIADGIKEDQKYVDKALEELVERGIVVEKKNFYSYVSTNRSKEFSEKITKLYEKVTRMRLEKLLIRGLLCEGPLNMNDLLETLEMEGFDREEIRSLLEEDMKKGYIKKIKFPELRNLYYYYPFIRRFFWYFRQQPDERGDYERLGEYLKRQGLQVQEEDYLVGSYPKEIANIAREYVNSEHQEIRRKLIILPLYSNWPRRW